jgi:hypothetical protein
MLLSISLSISLIEEAKYVCTSVILMFTLGLSIYTTKGVTQRRSQTLGTSSIEICDLICDLYNGTITTLV